MKRSGLKSTAALAVAIACLLFAVTDEAAADQSYIVQPGDSLSTIAYRFYGDQGQWPLLYQANRDRVEEGGNLLYAGTEIVIPEGAATAAGGAAVAYSSVYGKRDDATGLMEIDIVTGSDFTPWTDDELPNGGMVTEIVDVAFQKMGYKPAFEFINWPSGYRLTQKGKFAATFPYAPTDERMQSFLYSDSVYDTLTVVYTRTDSGFQFTQLSDLRGKRACRPAGYYTDFIDGMIETKELELQQPKSLEDCYDALLQGSADVVIITELEGNAKLKELGMEDKIAPSDKAIDISGLHVIFPKSLGESEKLLIGFNETVRDMAESGEIKSIVSRHLEDYYASFGN